MLLWVGSAVCADSAAEDDGMQFKVESDHQTEPMKENE